MPKRTFLRLDADKQERVMRAAIEEFLAHGFERALVSGIADKAGVAKGSMYQYFDDKRELFLYAVSWTLEYFMRTIDRQTPLAELDPFDYFLAGGRDRIELLGREPLLVDFSTEVYAGRFGSLADGINAEFRRIGDEYELRLIRNGQRRGTVRTDLSEDVLLLFFRAVTERFEQRLMEIARTDGYRLDGAHYDSLESLVGDMVSLLRGGMENPGCSST